MRGKSPSPVTETSRRHESRLARRPPSRPASHHRGDFGALRRGVSAWSASAGRAFWRGGSISGAAAAPNCAICARGSAWRWRLQAMGPAFIKLGQALVDPRRSDRRGNGERPRRNCRTGCRRSPRAAGARRHRARTGQADRRTLRRVRRRAGRRRLDRAGAFRPHHRGRCGRGQGLASRHRGGDGARPRPVHLAGATGRALAAEPAPPQAGRGGRDDARDGADRDGFAPRSRRGGRTARRISRATTVFACRGSIGHAPRAPC